MFVLIHILLPWRDFRRPPFRFHRTQIGNIAECPKIAKVPEIVLDFESLIISMFPFDWCQKPFVTLVEALLLEVYRFGQVTETREGNILLLLVKSLRYSIV